MLWNLARSLTTKFILPVALSGGVWLAVSQWNNRTEKIEAQHQNIVRLKEELREQNKTNRQLLKEKARLEALYSKEIAKKRTLKESLNKWRLKYDELSEQSKQVADWNSGLVPHAVVKQLRDQAREVRDSEDRPGFGPPAKVVPPSERHSNNATPRDGDN